MLYSFASSALNEVVTFVSLRDLLEGLPVWRAMISSRRRRTSMISLAWISMSVA